MKKYFSFAAFALLISATALSLTACGSDDDDDGHNYYVKYEILCSAPGVYGSSHFEGNINVMTDKGEITIKTFSTKSSRGYSWTETYGPFKRGQVVYLRGSIEQATTTARILVSVDQEPFALKKEQKSSPSVSIEHVIGK